MNRFFSDEISIDSKELKLSGFEFHHLKNVLRMKPGESIELFNGKGLLAEARLKSIDKRSANVVIKKTRESTKNESPVKITLLQGLLKGSKNEEVIKGATVLGATNIVFFQSEYTAIKPKKESQNAGLLKWRKVSIEAAKQCGRTILPQIEGPINLDEALKLSSDTFKIALYEAEDEIGLKSCLKSFDIGPEISVLVGPEGGLSKKDLETVRTAGFHTVSMGPRRLRSEAAAAAILSILGYTIGDIGGI